jgi:2,3-bisphosphoglycerate-dependent phosphoglycerate mutase
MYKIVFLRHGESVWNRKGLFTGWTDVALTKTGEAEARIAGRELRRRGFVFDRAWYSFLRRTKKTLHLVLSELDSPRLPVAADWRLNERHYGDLQGVSKVQMARKFGLNQVGRWRRGYDVHPPKITADNPYDQRDDKKYKGIKVPREESLKDVVARVVPFWREEVIPRIKDGDRILIAASGNSLRALIKYLDQVPGRAIVKLDIPFAIPLVYELDENLRPRRHYYLATKKKLAAEIARVRKLGEIKID